MNKEEIDNMSYEQLLRINRFAPLGDPRFQGETGKYFLEVMNRKKAELSPTERVFISKFVGWDK